MGNDLYTLDGDGKPVPAANVEEWARWLEAGERRKVAMTEYDGVRVSTVFLGIDHSFGGPTPVLWETMIIGGEHDGYQERHTSREGALAGHLRAQVVAWGKDRG